MPSAERPASRAALLLETLEQTQVLLEEHLKGLQRWRECGKL
jgi:hypothetical protein